ncbi:hypothetical protein HQ587_08020 [bacterium]|nr:hypothetical protein [bacterium]
MNIYLVVEGKCEKKVYSKWVRWANPNLRITSAISEVSSNHIYMVSGDGYPPYFDVIEDGARDVFENTVFDRLVVSVDSEDMSYEEKFSEISDFINSLGLSIDYRIIIQHFCLETWGLGNRVVVPRNPQTENVRRYRSLYDVLTRDPEGLPGLPNDDLNRSQFAARYLRSIISEKYSHSTYSKRNPSVLCNHKYYQRVMSRYIETGHIASFNGFLTAFK